MPASTNQQSDPSGDKPWAFGKVWYTTKREEPPQLKQTAACLIIGDEVLNGKVADTNSTAFARFCFSLGIDLKRIETIADDESEIMEAVRRMSSNYDFVITSGGIGPTHDDITYPSIAKAFSLPLKHHKPTIDRMKVHYSIERNPVPVEAWENPTPDLVNRLRMAALPAADPEKNPTPVDYIFPIPESWVPVVVVNRNIHILPGVPKIFRGLLEALQPIFISRGQVDLEKQSIYRVLISTPLKESQIANYLTGLQIEADKHGVKVGSYPRWGKRRNTITLTGRDKEWIEGVVPEVCKNVEGNSIAVEGEDDPESEKEKDEGIEGKVVGMKEIGERRDRMEDVTERMDVLEVGEMRRNKIEGG